MSTLILTVSHIYLYRIPGTSLGAKFLPLFETTKILVAPPKNDVLQKKCRLPSLNICQRIMVGKKNAVSRIGISYQHAIVGKTLVAIISVLGMKEQCSLKKQKNATFGRRRYILHETN